MGLPKAFSVKGWMVNNLGSLQATWTMLQHTTLLLKHKSDLGRDVNNRAGLHSNKTGAVLDRTDVYWPALGGAAGGLPKNQAFMAPSLVCLGSSTSMSGKFPPTCLCSCGFFYLESAILRYLPSYSLNLWDD